MTALRPAWNITSQKWKALSLSRASHKENKQKSEDFQALKTIVLLKEKQVCQAKLTTPQ